MIRKLQIKFVVINMAMVSAMLCVIFGLVYHFTQINLEAESISMMRTIAADPFHRGRPNEPAEQLRLPYFTVQLSARGELISTGGGYYDLSDQTFLRDLVDESVGSGRDTGVIAAHDLRFCRVSTPAGTVLVFADMSSETTTLNNLLRSSLLIGAISFLLFLCISIFLSRWAVKPVAAAWQQQKQFVADASHELKTPLTVIMTNADMLQSDEHGEAEKRTFAQNILVMSQQMKLLVEEMLELARADADQPAQQMRTLDLSRLILDTAISFEGVFADRDLVLESNIDPDITVHGSAQALRQAAEILLDNAQKYSAPGGTTTVRLRNVSGNKCRLEVANPGEEIPQEDLTKIFRRFYRMDKARGRSGSFGLGLSIAENIVSRHKGAIWAESGSGMNTFIIELHRST